MATVNLNLKVLSQKNKKQSQLFAVRNFPIYEEVCDVKDFLLENCAEELKPAKDRGFKIGYFGARGAKYHIQSREQLREAYETENKGWVTLWADPHSPFDRKHQKPADTPKQSSELSPKKAHLDSKEATDKETTEDVFKRLKAKHASKYNDFKLKCWAQMLVKGNHDSEDFPPQKPFFLGRSTTSSRTASSTTSATSAVTADGSPGSLSNSDMTIHMRGKIFEQLKALKDLKESEVINNEEFSREKEKLMQHLKELK